MLLSLIYLPLNLALFSSVLWVLIIFSLLARLCKTDRQFIMFEIASANWLNKILVPPSFKWSFDAIRCLTVIAFPWFMKWKFFPRHMSFKFLFTSATFLRYLSFFAVILDTDTCSFLFWLLSLWYFSAICWRSCFAVMSFAPTWSVTWLGVSLSAGCIKDVKELSSLILLAVCSPPYTSTLHQKSF